MKRMLFVLITVICAIFFVGCSSKLKINEELLKERFLQDGILISKGVIIPDEITKLEILDREDIVNQGGSKITNLELSLTAKNTYFNVDGTYSVSLKKHDTYGFQIVFSMFKDDVIEKINFEKIPPLDIESLKSSLIKFEKKSMPETTDVTLVSDVDYSSLELSDKNNIVGKARFEFSARQNRLLWYKNYSLELIDGEWTVKECLGQ